MTTDKDRLVDKLVMKSEIRNGIYAALRWGTAFTPTRPGNRMIYYHSVHPSLPRSMRPELFEEHLAFLVDEGFAFVTQRQIVEERLIDKVDRRWVAVGFDDGYEDNHEWALPILAKYNARATFYIVAGQVATTRRVAESGYQLYDDYWMLSPSQINEIASQGNEIASHGWQHELATQVIAERRDLVGDLRRSADELGKMSGDEVKSHSYPNGQKGSHSPETRSAVKAAGFSSSATTLWGRVKPGQDQWMLPRCEVSQADSVSVLSRKLLGGDDYLTLIHRIRRHPTWS